MFDWFPKNISTFGGDIDYVFKLIFYIVGIGFLLGELAILFFVVQFRRRDGQKAKYISGDKWPQLGWILIPTVLVLFLDLWIDFAGAKAYDAVKGEMPVHDVIVEVSSKQYNWIITYPGPDGVFATADDITKENDLHVPVNKVIKVVLKSQDVIHSFFVPVLRLKQDILPGRTTDVWFEATETGKYEIACAELCGYGHYTMRGFLHIHSEEEYAAWLAQIWPAE